MILNRVHCLIYSKVKYYHIIMILTSLSTEHNGAITMLKFNEDFTSLISSSTDKKIIKWDLSIMRV